MGILFLFTAQMIASYLGIYQEATYAKYGSAWKEGLFYTVHPSFPLSPCFLRVTDNSTSWESRSLSRSSPVSYAT